MPEQVKREMLSHMEQSIKVLKSGLGKVQTGRANPAMVEDVSVDYYGASTPLKQLATIVAPDANLLVVQPYDKTQMAIPKLSEERRRELTRVIKTKGEETKIALRNIRRDANDKLDQMKDNGDISEDDHHRYREKNDKAIHDYSKRVDDLVAEKSKQLQTI
jgi:ribosome recycling factor